jgi:hypothetical protein
MISAKDVIEIIKDLPDDKVNPKDYDSCVYTSPYDKDHHCIAGEVISRLGYRLPDVDSGLNEDSINALIDHPDYTLSREDFESLAVEILWAAQVTADNTDRETGEQKRWVEAKDSAFETYLDGMLGKEDVL